MQEIKPSRVGALIRFLSFIGTGSWTVSFLVATLVQRAVYTYDQGMPDFNTNNKAIYL